MSKYLLGIDSGSSFSKAAVFNFEGTEIASARRAVKTLNPQPGWSERDLDALWKDTVSAILEVLEKSGAAPEEIAAVGCTGHGNGLYLLDKQGKPLWNGIQSMDSRAALTAAFWSQNGILEKVFPITLQSFWAAQPNALLNWFKQNEPKVYEETASILMVKDYIKYKLTGEISSDYTDMSCANLVDIRNRCFSKCLMKLYGLPEMFDALPPLKLSSSIGGEVSAAAAEQTGLAGGTPVGVGMIDVDANAVGSGVVKPKQASVVMGSWSINAAVTEKPIIDPALFQTVIFADIDYFLTIEGSAASVINLEWFIRQFFAAEQTAAESQGASIYALCSELVDSIPPENFDLLFHPFLFGSHVQFNARGGFYGLTEKHTRADMLRAVYEGVVFAHVSHLENLRTAGAEISCLRLSGGGSRSGVWCQMLADAAALPIEVAEGSELGAKGVALAAGIGAGIYKNYGEAVERTVRIARRYEPDFSRTQHYRRRYGIYHQLAEKMREPWNSLEKIEQ